MEQSKELLLDKSFIQDIFLDFSLLSVIIFLWLQ